VDALGVLVGQRAGPDVGLRRGKFWLAVLNDLRRRGVEDVLISCVDGLKGFPEAIEAVFPAAWVQTCIVHLIRNSLRYVNYRDRKKVASALRPIYTAPNAEAALSELARFDSERGARYPATVGAWRASWEHVIPFMALPDELRRAVYTTNTIEGLHRQIRKAIKTRGHFPDEQAATKLIYLALMRADAKWQRNRTWTAPRAALKIHFADRFPRLTTTCRRGLTHSSSDSLRIAAVSSASDSSTSASSPGRSSQRPTNRTRPRGNARAGYRPDAIRTAGRPILKRRQPRRRDENVDDCDDAANVAQETSRSSEQLPRLAARTTRAIASRATASPPSRTLTEHPTTPPNPSLTPAVPAPPPPPHPGVPPL
jgi:hypothetical protein